MLKTNIGVNKDNILAIFVIFDECQGEWQFAPAYNLTFSYSGFGFHSTMIAGETRNTVQTAMDKIRD